MSLLLLDGVDDVGSVMYSTVVDDFDVGGGTAATADKVNDNDDVRCTYPRAEDAR